MIRILSKLTSDFVEYSRQSGALKKVQVFHVDANAITDCPDWIRNDPHFQRGVVCGDIVELHTRSEVKEAELAAANAKATNRTRREKITNAAIVK